jgi:hypothetical protein
MNACIDPLAARSIIIIDVLAIKMQSTSVKTDFIDCNAVIPFTSKLMDKSFNEFYGQVALINN